MNHTHVFRGAFGCAVTILFAGLLLNGCSSGGGGGGGVTVPVVPATDFGQWQLPDYREDDVTSLDPTEIGGVRVYFGYESGDYIRDLDIEIGPAYPITSDIADLIRLKLEELDSIVPVGAYFVVTVYDADGRESLFSNEVVAK